MLIKSPKSKEILAKSSPKTRSRLVRGERASRLGSEIQGDEDEFGSELTIGAT